jgi:hypothetical protein
MAATPSTILFAAGAGVLLSAIFDRSVRFLVPSAIVVLAAGGIGLRKIWYVFQGGRKIGRPGR